MINFKHGESYIGLFFVYIVVFIASTLVSTIAFRNGILAMPVLAALAVFLASSELKSGIALDGKWRARHRRGSKEYSAIVAWHVLVAIVSIVICITALV